MKKYLGLSVVMITGLLVSCSHEGYYGHQGYNGWMPMMGYGIRQGGMFMWIIFLVVIGLVIYFIAQKRSTKGLTPTGNESHLDILKRRYAKGEITKDEFDRIKKDLEG